MTKKRAIKKPYELQRRTAGLVIHGANKAAPVGCHLFYEVWMSDGSTKFERGATVHGVAHRIPENAKEALQYRSDLYEVMAAASILIEPLENACVKADGHEKKIYR
jgi:hypothetical protein